MKITILKRSFRLKNPFSISRGTRTEANVIVVCIEDAEVQGYGECVPYARYNESLESVSEAILDLQFPINRSDLQEALPAGAARNAVDCALWDIEAKQKKQPVWQLAGLSMPKPVMTAFTISLDHPDGMYKQALENHQRPLLKIKLDNEKIEERVIVVRKAAPNARLIVDANEAWNLENLESATELFKKLNIEMIEQPFAASHDDQLDLSNNDIVICADESCHDTHSLKNLNRHYGMINIKLDKTGGLTDALALRKEAQSMGFDIMAGCMIGSSLSMAPAMLIAQHAKIVDLDAPMLLAEDVEHPMQYTDGYAQPPSRKLWG